MPSNTVIELSTGRLNMSVQTSLSAGDTLSIRTNFDSASASAPSLDLSVSRLPSAELSPLEPHGNFRKRASTFKPSRKTKKRAKTSYGDNPDAITSDFSDTEVSESDEVFYAARSSEDPRRPVRIIRRVLNNLPIVPPPPAPPARLIPATLAPQFHRAYTEIMNGLNFFPQSSLTLESGSLALPVQQAPRKKKKKGKKPPQTRSARNAFDVVLSGGRWLVRAQNPYRDFDAITMYGPEALWGSINGEPAEDVNQLPAVERESRLQAIKDFRALMDHLSSLMPVIKQMFLDSALDKDPWDALWNVIETAAKDARYADTNKVKNKPSYMVPDPSKHVIFPPLLDERSKSDRDLSHPMLRYLLMPNKDRCEFPPLTYAPPQAGAEQEMTPPLSILALIREGKYRLRHKDFPSAFYEEGVYDPSKFEVGLFRGHLIVRNLRAIWTGDNSAILGPTHKGLPKVCAARLHNVFEVTPPMVAYAGGQGRVSLSKGDWGEEATADYDPIKFFNRILKKDWADETLAWLTQQVFGTHTAENNDAGDHEESDDEIERQMDARARSDSVDHHPDRLPPSLITIGSYSADYTLLSTTFRQQLNTHAHARRLTTFHRPIDLLLAHHAHFSCLISPSGTTLTYSNDTHALCITHVIYLHFTLCIVSSLYRTHLHYRHRILYSPLT
ncbi:hypothetical protein GGX14DRAFT_392113 [Mycena pura]|uniref:Uncharacterized protein n=1 Tax=Mycena pura TaxID=153505 RepID=A0AAD6VJJ9_9AGAR|nr:hypothetical protein GGX14DRAFT_392113 [Mycena pura]